MTTSVCKNCHNHFRGNFCNTCGQAAETHELNFHFLWHDIQHGLFHLDKGIWFTGRELFRRPGHSIREYVEGKRVKHFKPISLVIVLAGVYGVLFHYLKVDLLGANITFNGDDAQASQLRNILTAVNEWVAGHYAVVAMVQLPLYALGTFLAFKKEGYNYVEHLVLNAFLTGQRLMLHILFFPTFFLISGEEPLKRFSGLVDTVGVALAIWALIQFFNKTSKWKTFFRAVYSYLIFLLMFLALMALAAFVVYSRF